MKSLNSHLEPLFGCTSPCPSKNCLDKEAQNREMIAMQEDHIMTRQ